VLYGMPICVLFAGSLQNENTVEIPVSPPAYLFCKITDRISMRTEVLTSLAIKMWFHMVAGT
jgi:hypothetical protein